MQSAIGVELLLITDVQAGENGVWSSPDRGMWQWSLDLNRTISSLTMLWDRLSRRSSCSKVCSDSFSLGSCPASKGAGK